MISFTDLLAHGTANAWLFIPSAILLGALHGLEPGHSKTMMAAFIIAIRGTVMQAVLLGLSATLSHTAIVWVVALIGLQLGSQFNTEAVEPLFQMVAGGLVILLAAWMLHNQWREHQAAEAHAHGHHTHGHHDHDDRHDHDHDHAHETGDYLDAHARAHAHEIEQRFAGQHVTTGQIVLFGLTGGLIPCPASITILLICLQLKQLALGATLVLCFSIGLAITMVSVGAIAAVSMHQVSKRWSGFSRLAAGAPWLSGLLMLCVGGYMFAMGWTAHLPHG